MKPIPVRLILALLAGSGLVQAQQPPRVIDLHASDGTLLKASYFAAATPGPGVLLFHQGNRTRASWEAVARQLAAAGIHTLTVDSRGHGESGGKAEGRKQYWSGDLDTAVQYLRAQPGVNRDVIGLGGAGSLGVDNSVEAARRHSAEVKSLVLLSGETLRPQLQFLHEASELPELFVFSDDDEYPPTQEAMQLLYISASSPSKKLVHYSKPEEAPWQWYEPVNVGKVPAKGGHGTDMFAVHPELPGIIVHWFVTTLLTTPGHAPADALAAASVLVAVEFGGGAAHATQQLMEARQRDPQAQLWPEISMSIIGQDFMREGELKSAVEVLKLNLLAYPRSADANETLAEAYAKDGQKDLARQHAKISLALLDARTQPASSWTDTEQYRGEIRRGAQKILEQLGEEVEKPSGATVERAPGAVFRDCPDCPEMVVLPAGRFTMGSTASEKSWAASHGGNLESVADESPQRVVTLPSFALGTYDVTRGEYAAFARETGYPAGDGCGPDSFKWNKQAGVSWQKPGFSQTERDPVVCVSWQDARAYIAWLNGKVPRPVSASADGPYRLPSEAEWEYAARAGTATRFWWGDEDGDASGHAWYKGNSDGQTHQVGLKPANAFGLYNIVGDVWQWTADCYAASYANAPTDGSPAGTGDACLRVDRGSCWLYPAWLLRSATRERNPADYRDIIMGFRVARALE